MKESQIQRAIMDYLAAERIPAFRMNTGAMFGSHKGKKWAVRFGQKGMADIFATPWTGRVFGGTRLSCLDHLWIEVKTAKGVQSDDQVEFQRYVEENGMEYLLARSVDDVREWIEMRK